MTAPVSLKPARGRYIGKRSYNIFVKTTGKKARYFRARVSGKTLNSANAMKAISRTLREAGSGKAGDDYEILAIERPISKGGKKMKHVDPSSSESDEERKTPPSHTETESDAAIDEIAHHNFGNLQCEKLIEKFAIFPLRMHDFPCLYESL